MAIVDVPVSLGKFGINKKTANVSVKIDRACMSLQRAEEIGNSRLSGRLIRGAGASGSGQEHFTEPEAIESHFDTNAVSIKPDHFGTSLTFPLDDIASDLELKHFAMGMGRLIIEDIGDIPKPEKKAKADPAQKSMFADGPWRKVPVENIYGDKPRVCTALEEKDIKTMGDLSDWLNAGNTYRDLKGVGEKAAEWMEEQDVAFWAENPQEDDEDDEAAE